MRDESMCEQLVKEVFATKGATVISPTWARVPSSTTRFDRAVGGERDGVPEDARHGRRDDDADDERGAARTASSAAFYVRASGAEGVEVGEFEEYVLRYVRERICGDILRAGTDRGREPGAGAGGAGASVARGSPMVGSRNAVSTPSQASYADEFPSLGMAPSKKSSLEARIWNSPMGAPGGKGGEIGRRGEDEKNRRNGGNGRNGRNGGNGGNERNGKGKVNGVDGTGACGEQGAGQAQGRRRIVPTAIQSVEVNEQFARAVRAHDPVWVADGAKTGAPVEREKSDKPGMSEAKGKPKKRIQPLQVSSEVEGHSSGAPIAGQPMTPTVSRLQHGMDRLALQIPGSTPGVGTSGQGASGELGGMSRGISSSFDSPLAFVLPDDGEEEDLGADDEADEPSAMGAMAKLHGRILRCSSRIFLISELSLVLDVLVVDPSCRVEAKERHPRDPQDSSCGEDGSAEERIGSGADAVSYASNVLVNAGPSLVVSLGTKVLRELLSFLVMRARSMGQGPRSVYRLKRMVAGALREAESSSFLHSSSPSTANAPSSGRLLGLTGLNVFLSDGGSTSSRTADEQRRLSNRETFRDDWFKLMRDAVNRSSSLDAKAVVGTADSRTAAGSGPEQASPNAGDATVLRIIQEDSSQLLRGLRVDNYEPFAELFTAAVLQAAATGETIMDEELTGIAKQNLSRFQSLNKRFQMNSGSGMAGNPDRGRARGSLPKHWKKGQVDYSAEHALRVSSEFPKSLRPFVLFLEATDSHRLDLSVANSMRAKLGSIARSSTEPSTGTGVLDVGVLSIDELCISSTALAGFLGYFSFSKGRDTIDELSPVILRLRERGEYDGSHHIDVLSAILGSLGVVDSGLHMVSGPSGVNGTVAHGHPGTLFRSLPWICRYLKMLSWDSRQARSAYFQSIFGVLRRIRSHPYLQPCGRMYRGVASLCLRGMLDDLIWIFPEESCSHMPVHLELSVDDKIDATLGEDILWANENMGRRYLEVTVPDLSYLESVVSVKTVKSSQTVKAVKKIRPTAPITTAKGIQPETAGARIVPSRLGGRPDSTGNGGEYEPGMGGSSGATTSTSGSEWGDTYRKAASSNSKEETIKELERVFLDQYSTSSRVTDLKLRDFVTWCSDAVARQGVASGLDAAGALLRQKVLDGLIMEIRDFVRQKRGEVSKGSLQEACAAMEDHFAAEYYSTVKGPALQALKKNIVDSSKSSAEILLPQAWGEHVRMTAAAIVARRAQAAGSRQLVAELKQIGKSKTRSTIDAAIKKKD
jgi:hypothetical protein